MNHSSISDIRALLESEGLALKKRFGQNFLIDENARTRIAGTITERFHGIEQSPVSPVGASELWEIGPGIGAITDLLVSAEIPLRLFEIDRGIVSVLQRRYGDNPPIEVGDFIVTGPAATDTGHVPAMICGNLPYASASSIVARIIEHPIPAETMVFMVQKELADRFRAQVGTKDYSALSVLVQNNYTTRVLFHVSGGAFYPRPRVGSTVIVMERSGPVDPERNRVASLIARTAFGQRRKALRNSLRDYAAAMETVGIDSGLRPENLAPSEYVALATAVMRDRTPS